MAQPLSDHFLRRALLAADSAPPLPAALTDRVMDSLDAKWGSRRAAAKPSAGLRLYRLVADAPPALLALAAALLLLLGPLLLVSRNMAMGGALPLLAYSARETGISTGDSLRIRGFLRESRDLSTAAGGHLTLLHDEALAIHLFEEGRLRIKEGRARLSLELLEGALYLDRRSPLPGKDILISAFGQELSLSGTSLYAERSADSWLILCAEGGLSLALPGKGKLADIGAGEYILASADGQLRERGAISTLPPDYGALFSRMKPLPPPGDPEMGKRPAGFRGWIIPQEGETSEDLGEAGPTEGAAPPQKAEEPPFTVSALGRLPGYAPEDALSTFRAPFSLGGQEHIALPKGIYRLAPDGLELRKAFERDIVAPPLISGSSLIVFHADGLSILSAALAPLAEATYPEEGRVQNGFFPILDGKSLIIPLQGAGFYRFDLATRAFSLLKAEVFPATPLALPGGWLSASFYRNAYALHRTEGSQAWEYRLPGESWLAPLAMGKEIVLYSEEESGPRLIALDQGGKLLRSLPLPEKLVSDMVAAPGALLLATAGGRLLGMDWPGGKTRELARIHSGGLSSAQARNLRPSLSGREVLALGASGELEIFSLPGWESTLKTKLNASAPFELQPFVSGRRIYALARDGSLFKVERRAD